MKTKVKRSDNIFISAPGKVILHGEHAVVYGKKALAASLDRRTFLQLEHTNDGKIALELPDIDIVASWSVEEVHKALNLPICEPSNPQEPSEEVKALLFKLAGLKEEEAGSRDLALVAFLYLYASLNGQSNGMYVKVVSQLPPSAGLGSSAAYGTCLSAALLLKSGEIGKPEPVEGSEERAVWTEPRYLKLINDWAFQAEKIIHGRPSGIDNSISSYGGGIIFQSGIITPLKKVPNIDILLTNTKVPRSTKVLVAGVRERYNKYPTVMEPLLTSIEALTIECEHILTDVQGLPTADQIAKLQELINMNQYLLGAIGVSHKSIEDICSIALEHGFYTKLTGAGGGGCVFTLLPPGTTEEKVTALKNALHTKGYSCWHTSFGGHGVTQHLNMTTLDISC